MPDTALAEADYEAIETALRETERGRWFLAEHARRNRAAETRLLLQAIEKLERVVHDSRAPESAAEARGAEPAADARAEIQADEAGLDMASAAAEDGDRDADGVEVRPAVEPDPPFGAAPESAGDDRGPQPTAEASVEAQAGDMTLDVASAASDGVDEEAIEGGRPAVKAGSGAPSPKAELDAMTPEEILALFG